MTYPPALPDAPRTDVTVSADTHADDHNRVRDALQAVIDVLGADPAGSYADLTSRLLGVAAGQDQAALDAFEAALDAVTSALEAATALTGIDVIDDAVAALISTILGPNTQAALSAKISAYAAPLPTTGRHPLTGMFHADGYGAVADDATDNAGSIQAAIDAAYADGGGDVFFDSVGYYRVASSIILKDGVTLRCDGPGTPYAPSASTRRAVLRAATAGIPVVTDDGSNLDGAGIDGICVQGLTSGGTYASEGFKFTYASRCTFKNWSTTGTTGSGFKLVGGIAPKIHDGIVVNACLNRTPGALVGAVDINASDPWVKDVEATCSTTLAESTADTNFFLAAFALRGANGYYEGLIGEISTVGFSIASTVKYSRFVGCRADLNWAHGWINAGNRNLFSACTSITNGRIAVNTYSGFRTTGYGNAYAACAVHGDSGSVKFGFEDTLSGNFQNAYDPTCISTHHATAAFSFATFLGASLGVAKVIRPANGTTSINVEGAAVVDLASYSAPATVTAFTNGVGGQTIRVLGDPDVTIQNNASILTNTAADKVLAAGSVYTFTLNNAGVWVEGADDGRARRLATVTGIDAKTTGTTTLYTVPTGKTAIITAAIIRCTAASAITVAPTLGIGVAAGEDDIFTSTALTGLTATTKEWHAVPAGLTVKIPAAAVIKVGIDTAATGTSQTLAIDLIGYLV